MRRTLILLTEAQHERLAELAKRRGNSLAALVRQAVEEYLRREAKYAAQAKDFPPR
jgi:predicted DNA-binding protein